MSEEPLVSGDDHVRCGDQSCEEWIGNTGVGVIFEEESGFVFVDIEAKSAEAMCLHGVQGGGGVDEAAAARVD